MQQIVSNERLAGELFKRGLVPPECRQVSIVIDVHGVLVMRYDVMVVADTLDKVADAMKACAAAVIADTPAR